MLKTRNISGQVVDYDSYDDADLVFSESDLLGLFFDGGNLDLKTWSVGCVSISVIFALATFIVYTVVPELRNHHGSIFRCYLASYICCMLLFITDVLLNAISRASAEVVVTDYTLVYFGGACISWLNVMCFDIWSKFRKFRASSGMNILSIKEREKKMFVRYSIYAWVSPALYFVLFVIMIFCFPGDSVYGSVFIMFGYCVSSVILVNAIGNISLFILTALAIKKRRQETANLLDGANKHYQENKQWFNLYVKLFIIMGGTLVAWVIGIYARSLLLWKFVYVAEALQGILIFVTFVWKDDVKRLCRKRFNEMLCTMRSCLSRSSVTPATEISIISTNSLQ